MSLRTKIRILCLAVGAVTCLSACLPKPQNSGIADYEEITEVFTPATDNGENGEIGQKYSALSALVASGETVIAATDADFEYKEISGGVKITKYTGEYKSEEKDDYIILSIPETIEGKSVVSIGKEAFNIVAHLDAVIIPDSVTKIESMAFYGCNYLTYVSLGENTKTIGEYAFAMCPSLYSIDLSSVESIELGAFIGCDSMNTVTLSFIGGGSDESAYLGYIFGATGVEFNKEFVPDSLRNIILSDKVSKISDLAFYNCQYITAVVIPDSVTSIGVRAFYKCRSLVEIDTGNGVKTIADDAFFGCDSLKSIKLGAALENLGMQAFLGCTVLEKVELPETLSEIKVSTFYGCTALKEVDLANVKTVGKDAFGRCEALTPPDISRVESIAEGNDKLYNPEDEK